MKLLVYGAGVLGSLFAVRMHEAGHEVALLARGKRLAALRRHGVLLAEGDSPDVRAVPVPIAERPENGYDLTAVLVRTHQVDAVLESLAGVDGDVLFLLNWAAGPQPLQAALGPGRVLIGFPMNGGTMDGDVVRYRASSAVTRLVPMPIGEPDGSLTPRLERIVRTFRAAGLPAQAEPRMNDWLRTHAALEVPLGQAVHAAGGPKALAADTYAIRSLIHRWRRELPAELFPRWSGLVRTVPEGVMTTVLRRFLRSTVAGHSGLADGGPATIGELDRLAEQLRDS